MNGIVKEQVDPVSEAARSIVHISEAGRGKSDYMLRGVWDADAKVRCSRTLARESRTCLHS